MVFLESLTWTCHICREERPDRFISVCKVPTEMNGIQFEQNVRHCNDRQACIDAAPSFSFIKQTTGGGGESTRA